MNKRTWLLMFLLLVLIVPARVADVNQFATIDEPWWVISGSNFYYALTHREFANTSYDYHPAVTTMWVVTAGMVSYFPEYRIHAPGYFDVRKPLFENFMRAQGKDSLPLVRNSRLIQIAVIVFLALLGFFLLQLLIDEKAAFFSIALAVNAPFFMGHSRLLNHEALLAMFSLVTLLAMQVYLQKERQWIYLLISGAAFGLAQLTKSSSIVLLPLIGLMILIRVIVNAQREAIPAKAGALFLIKVFSIWLAAAVVVYFLLWPGMWVAPKEMFANVYGNAFSYAFEGSRLEVADVAQKQITMTDRVLQFKSYATQWLRNSTPLSSIGLILAFAFFFAKNKSPLRSTLAYLLGMAALVIALFSVSSGRDSAHYILTSYVGLDVMAGIGWVYLCLWAQKKWDKLNHAFFLPLVFSALLVFQLGESLSAFPYYYTYKNPFSASGGTHGYGEGLDLAAEYLAQKPGAQDTYAIVYAGRGCFSYFYPGRTEHMKSGIADGLPYIEDLKNADYFVVYNIYQKAKPEGRALIQFMSAVPPEKIITLDGLEYARIYQTAGLPANIFEILTREVTDSK